MELTAATLDDIRITATRELDQSKRGALGQFMTPSQIAGFMAGLFTYGKSACLLDAGAGIGSLTSAFLDRAIEHGTKVVAPAPSARFICSRAVAKRLVTMKCCRRTSSSTW